MIIYTKWTCYGGEIGVTAKGEYYNLSSGVKLNREYHQVAIYYRARASTKRYSWSKCNRTRIKSIVEIKPKR